MGDSSSSEYSCLESEFSGTGSGFYWFFDYLIIER